MADAPARSVEEALTRARHHTQRALGEGVRAARAILDAASLAALGHPVDERSALSGVRAAIDDIAQALEGGTVASPLFDALHDGLDREIGRWEERAETDRDARAVLRAFIGVREILWEMGVRKRQPGPAGARGAGRSTAGARSAANEPRQPDPMNDHIADSDSLDPPAAQAPSRPERTGVTSPAPRRRVQRVDIDG